MNIKKLILICVLAIMSIASVSAVTTLTSCGKNSGWINGETYILDFNSIPSSYGSSNCFVIPTSQNGITFTSNNNSIQIEKSGISIVYFSLSNDLQENYIFKDLILNSDGVSNTNLINNNVFHSSASNYLNNFEFENVFFYNFETILKTGSVYSGSKMGMDSLNVNNSYIDTNYFWYASAGNPTFDNIQNSLFLNSYLIIRNTFQFANQYDNLFEGLIDSDFENVYITSIDGISQTSNNYLTNSILKGDFYSDSNLNNVGDGTPTYAPFQITPKLIIQILGNNVYQDMTNTIDLYDTYAENQFPNLYPNDEILLDSITGMYFTNDNGESNEFLGTLIIEKQNNLIINGGINCNIFTSENCLIQDDISYSAVTTNKFRGLLNVGGATIEGMTLNKLGSSNSNLISNFIDTYSTGLIIQNNILNKQDDRVDDDDNELVNLKSNNLNINNNEFSVYYTGSQSYEFLNIESTTPNSNKITENYFHQDLVSSKTTQQVFNSLAETTFSNNKLGESIVISDSLKSDLNVNPFVSVEYSGSIYYFQIGNFYEDNSGCVDGDGNGICDSPYTSGAIVDNFPLSTYPYNYLAHLGDASSVVVSGAFNITLNIVDGQTFTLNDLGTDTINISFNHDSEFPDLTCSYIIDGSSITDFSNVENTIEHSLLIGSLTEKTYSYRVECLNDYIFQSSSEITFEVVLDSGETGGTGGSEGSGGSTTGSGDINIDLFSGDIEDTNDSVSSFLSNIINFIFNMAVPLSIIFIILLAFFSIIIVVA